MENLLFMAYHGEILDDKGKVEVPACIITIQQINDKDCFGEKIIAKLNQRYARPNKKIGKIITLDNFKGKKGISQDFYSENEITDYLKILIDENYHVQRATKYLMNDIADRIFEEIKEYSLEQCRKNGGFKLPL